MLEALDEGDGADRSLAIEVPALVEGFVLILIVVCVLFPYPELSKSCIFADASAKSYLVPLCGVVTC